MLVFDCLKENYAARLRTSSMRGYFGNENMVLKVAFIYERKPEPGRFDSQDFEFPVSSYLFTNNEKR